LLEKPGLPRRSRRLSWQSAFASVPQRVQWQTAQEILSVTLRNIGAPERATRQCMPIDFYATRGKR